MTTHRPGTSPSTAGPSVTVMAVLPRVSQNAPVLGKILADQGVGQNGTGVNHGGRAHQSTIPAVRRDKHVMGFCLPGNVEKVEQATHADDVGAEDIGRLFLQGSAEVVQTNLSLTGDDRHGDLATALRHIIEPFPGDRLLEPAGIERGEGMGGLNGESSSIKCPDIDHHLHVIADRFSHATDRLRGPVQRLVLHGIELQGTASRLSDCQTALHQKVDGILRCQRIHVGGER